MKRRRQATFLAGVVRAVVFAAAGGGLTAGCLPEGGPGIGERVLPARGLSSLVAGLGDNRPLLFTRWMDGRNYAGQPARVLDLYHLPPGQPEAQRVQEDVVAPLQFDARGRLYLRYGWALDPDAAQRPDIDPKALDLRQLRRVDLLAGVTTELGWVHHTLLMSPGGTHVAVHLPGDRWVTRTLNDKTREIAGGVSDSAYWVGEDFCLVVGGRLTCALAEGGEPIHPASRTVLTVDELSAGAGAPELVAVVPDEVARAAGDEDATELWLVRLRPLPGQPQEMLLSRGREQRAADVASGESQVAVLEGRPSGPVWLRLVTFGAGAPVLRDLLLPPVFGRPDRRARLPWSPPRFRPGRGEVWALATDGQLAILRADGSQQFTRVAPGAGSDAAASTFPAEVLWTADALTFENASGAAPSVRRELFTADSRWWVYRRGDYIHLADADDPAAPSRLQTPVTAVRGVADILGQDRLVLWASFGYADQVQVRVHDRQTLQPVGTSLEEVRRLVVSRRGMLALVTGRSLHELDGIGPGKLVMTTTDGATPGLVQTLAENVTQFAVLSGCAGCDPIQAGSRLAYLVHARVPWKYDGLWMAELP